MTASAEQVLAEANRQGGTSWQLHGRLSGGYQSGAYLVTDPHGRRAVLKWSDSTAWAPTVLAAEPVVRSARAQGWPTAAWTAVGLTTQGHAYQIQDFVEGTTQPTIDDHWLDLVLPVVAGQARLGGEGMRNWSVYDYDVVFSATNDNRAAVAGSGPSGADLVEVVRRLNREHAGVQLPDDDLVHGDLNPENVLVGADRSVTLIDVEAVGRGTRLHDLTTLLLYSVLWGEHAVRDRLIGECRSIAAPGGIGVVLSAVTIDLLAFGVRQWPAHDLSEACRAAAALLLAVPLRSAQRP